MGVSRRVKIFDFAACLEGGDSVMHYPALQITTRSKLSSVCWNSYVKSQLITSDYSGLIQLWDASTAAEAAQYDEHARRVWSVDFSTTDPMRFLRWVGGAGGWVGGWVGQALCFAMQPAEWAKNAVPTACGVMLQQVPVLTPPPSSPHSFAWCSGSDDGSVRLWSVHEQSSVSRIAAPANVCSVQFR